MWVHNGCAQKADELEPDNNALVPKVHVGVGQEDLYAAPACTSMGRIVWGQLESDQLMHHERVTARERSHHLDRERL